MILRGPGFDRPRVVSDLVSLVDVAPTLLETAGIEVPQSMQGASFLRLSRGDSSGWRNEVLVHTSEAELGRTIRTEQWKYCVFDPASKPAGVPHSLRYVERYLYDLKSDPHEHVNLIGRREYRSVADELRDRLLARLTAIGEPTPQIEPARFYA